MLRFISILLLVYLAGCTTPGGHETTSGWSALLHSSKVECSIWPLRDKDLQIDDLTWIGGRKPGFLLAGLKRDASPLNYFAPFSGDEAVDPEQFASLNLGPHAVMLGGGTAGGQNMVVVAHNSGGKSTFDVRSLASNIVKYKGDLGPFQVVEGNVTQAKGSLWLSVKSEDNIYHLVQINTAQPGKWGSKALASPTYNEQPKLLGGEAGGGVTVLWKEGDTGKPLKLQVLHADGSMDAAITLDLQVTSQMESWSATNHAGIIYLALIDGDTMIGQAEVKVAAVYQGSAGTGVKWTKAIQLRDTHAQEPIFVATNRGLEVLVLNWIDEESTIARYMIAGANIGKPTYSGVFQKGSRILEAFAGPDQNDAFVVTRSRNDKRWAYQLCKI